MWNHPRKMFFKYVMPSVFGMIGISAYILADTFFISVAGGADGIATLNLVLPIYSVIFAIGSMIGVGAATRFSLYTALKDKRAKAYYSNSILFGILIGMFFSIIGILFPEAILRLMGGDETVIKLGTPYLRIAMAFAPFFILNYIFGAFTRNDGAPTTAMIATVVSSLFNIVFDYILMFPMKLGMTGAALATACSPIVGSLICFTHLLSKKSTLKFRWQIPSLKILINSCQLGIPAFIGEFASGVTTFIFNLLILGLTGNDGVAAFGVIANISLVVLAVFNGISQGGQPLFSYYYGTGDLTRLKKVLKYSVICSVLFSFIIITFAIGMPESIVAIFNSGQNEVMAQLAVVGMRIYFVGMLFAGINIVITGYLGAIGDAFWSTIVSILRGVILISIVAIVLAKILKMDGVWMAFPVTEVIVMIVAIGIILKKNSIHLSKNVL